VKRAMVLGVACECAEGSVEVVGCLRWLGVRGGGGRGELGGVRSVDAAREAGAGCVWVLGSIGCSGTLSCQLLEAAHQLRHTNTDQPLSHTKAKIGIGSSCIGRRASVKMPSCCPSNNVMSPMKAHGAWTPSSRPARGTHPHPPSIGRQRISFSYFIILR
jgi:hypothetical protein